MPELNARHLLLCCCVRSLCFEWGSAIDQDANGTPAKCESISVLCAAPPARDPNYHSLKRPTRSSSRSCRNSTAARRRNKNNATSTLELRAPFGLRAKINIWPARLLVKTKLHYATHSHSHARPRVKSREPAQVKWATKWKQSSDRAADRIRLRIKLRVWHSIAQQESDDETLFCSRSISLIIGRTGPRLRTASSNSAGRLLAFVRSINIQHFRLTDASRLSSRTSPVQARQRERK